MNKFERIIRYTCLIAAVLTVFYMLFSFYTSMLAREPQIVNEQIDDTAPRAYSYFKHEAPAVYHLARKIERQDPITVDEVKALPEGSLNARYEGEITLLYFALDQYNLQAIDALLAGGADPYMIDQPSTGSGRDFTYYMGAMNMSSRPDLGVKFKTDLIKIYLKNGGDPNHKLPGQSGSPFFYYVALMKNFDGVEVLLKAGANPLVYDNDGNFNAVISLALNRDERSMKLVCDIVCHGAFDFASDKAVSDIVNILSPSGPDNPKREAVYKKLAMRILKYHPNFKENPNTQRMFNGSIPWKDILALDDKELCNDQ
ncbi:hypothetical protein [Bartonella apis]|uniref:hypothetical protein n=1 Tax=Bartonella apis TaxID=1686310 RepID=UPI00095AFEBB|nr:hypothetical protein [Bartonella apis]OLY47638.1 hypothetical protein PEB0122_016540 [Bartonella apis]